jgi:tRNA dimethylallyltransferase
MAARLNAEDPQRQARALEVIRATGRSLDAWQRQAVPASRDYEVLTLAALPPRAELYARIDRRLAQMLAEGALDEVQGLMDQGLDPQLPAMKAVGVPQLMAYLRDQTSRATALAAAQTATRRYAKRQLTWLRHQTPRDAARAVFLYAQFSESLLPLIFNEIREFGLTAQP